MAGLIGLQQFRCKTCGEPLDLSKAQNGVIKCAICDSIFTLPKDNADQKVLSFLSQGEHDLDTGKFDDAYTAFYRAAELDPTEPEAYWGMALAEFKVQYLKDEVNNRLQPICHDVTDKKFIGNENFMRALVHGTSAQMTEYKRKASEIEYINGEFYKLKESGLDYDCFICVKVTDDNGGRTVDYKHADDIYFALKGKGYKPFFSERELGNVTGADYEARILYALHSSECMLVVCFDEAYLRTKWVKNEYSRFLKLVNDEEKESDSIALVFGDRPVEKLPGKKGKIQGIALNSLTAMERIVSFVDAHTPEARARKEEQEKQKAQENETQRKKFAEQEERIKQQEELIRQQAERFKQLEEMFKAQQSAPIPASTPSPAPIPATAKPAAVKPAPAPKPVTATRHTKETSLSDFEIKDGVLIKYKGEAYSVEIPNSVSKIGDKAFQWSKITDLIIPNSVKEIGSYAFSYCERLKKITLPNSIEKIDIDAFVSCKALTCIEIPSSVTWIGNSSFYGCSGLERITVDDNNPEYKSVNNCLLTKDGKVLALGCKNSVIPESVNSIGVFAFSGCSELTKIILPNAVKNIYEHAFTYCKGLKSIEIPNGVTRIDDGAFSGCDGLTSITIPSSVKSIGVSVTKKVMNVFSYCRGLESITVDINNPSYKSINNCLLTKDGKTLIAGCKNSIIPDGVTNIGNYAFSGCNGLTSIILPDSVTTIGIYAFSRCDELKSLEISDSVIDIGSGALNNCKNLAELTLPKRFEKNIKTILGDEMLSSGKIKITYTASDFEITDGILKKYIGKDTKAVIPNRVKSIEPRAFYKCKNLTIIIIPSSVKSIGQKAFELCNKLTSITLPDSVTSVGKFAFLGCNELNQINCRAEKKPKDWDKNWDKKEDKLIGGRHKVIWGYKGN